MLKNGYCEKLNIKYSELDQNLLLKPFSLLNFLQDIASKNAEDLGFGYSYIHPKNLAWFLLKYRMEFIDYPMDISNITLATEPRGYNRLFAFRDFEIFKEEKLIARIASTWSVIDINTHSIIPVGTALTGCRNMQPFEKREDDLTYNKISAITTPTKTQEFEVRYNDIDVNGHANNGNYIIWALEPLNFEFKNSHKIKALDMIYKKEAKFGEKIISQIEIKDNLKTVHRLTNINNEDLFLLECDWTNI